MYFEPEGPGLPGSVQQPDSSNSDPSADRASDESAARAATNGAPVGHVKTIRTVLRTIEPPPPPRSVKIGAVAQERMLDGELLQDEHVVELVVHAILDMQAAFTQWKADGDSAGRPATNHNGTPTVTQVHGCRDCRPASGVTILWYRWYPAVTGNALIEALSAGIHSRWFPTYQGAGRPF